MNIKPLRVLWAVLIIVILSMIILPIQAQEQYCPDTKYKSKYKNGRSAYLPDWCFFENDISFRPTIHKADDCKFHLSYYKNRGIEILKEYKSIRLHSETHPISIWIKLNRKEFREKNRDYWIQKGMEFLHTLENANESCMSADNSAHSVETGTGRQSDDGKKSMPVENKKTKSSWDDLTAPSAK